MRREVSSIPSMLSILGILVVLAAVFGGYVLEKGNLYVLVQPANF
jgi:flagellar motor component MotA